MGKPLGIDQRPREVGLFPARIAKLITCPFFWSFNSTPTPPHTHKNPKNSKKGKHPNRSPPARLPTRFISFKRKTKTRPNLPSPWPLGARIEQVTARVLSLGGSYPRGFPPRLSLQSKQDKTNSQTLLWGREGLFAAGRGSETEKLQV